MEIENFWSNGEIIASKYWNFIWLLLWLYNQLNLFYSTDNKWINENKMSCPRILSNYFTVQGLKQQANGDKRAKNNKFNQTPIISTTTMVARSKKLNFK